MIMALKAGDRVRIKPEWRDACEQDIVYVIVELNGDRAYVQPVKCKLRYVPTSLVGIHMIHKENAPCEG